MGRRFVTLCLLVVGLVLIAAPALLAAQALLDGDAELAWRVFGPVLLVPAALLVFGVVRSFRR
jgi:hypothetical protein